jgi:hypothetical protein
VTSSPIPAEADRIERRIEQFTAVFGATATLIAAWKFGLRAGGGAALGAALCLLNFRWLRHGATGVIALGMAQAGAEAVHVPRSMHAKFFGRLVLLLVAVYVILKTLKLPGVAVLCGLTVVVPAIVTELVYELVKGHQRWTEQ